MDCGVRVAETGRIPGVGQNRHLATMGVRVGENRKHGLSPTIDTCIMVKCCVGYVRSNESCDLLDA